MCADEPQEGEKYLSNRTKFQRLDRHRVLFDLEAACAALKRAPLDGIAADKVKAEFSRLLAVEHLVREGVRSGIHTVVAGHSVAEELYTRAQRLKVADDDDFLCELSIFEGYLQYYEQKRT
jgi:hypothetical protein